MHYENIEITFKYNIMMFTGTRRCRRKDYTRTVTQYPARLQETKLCRGNNIYLYCSKENTPAVMK